MNCDEAKALMMARLDGELLPEQSAALEDHLAECEQCRREFDAFGQLQQELKMFTFKEPTDAELARYWSSVYNRLERGIGWIMFSLGSIVLLCWGAFELLEEVIMDPKVPAAVKVGTVAVVFGIVVLIVSVARERLATRKADKYSKEVER